MNLKFTKIIFTIAFFVNASTAVLLKASDVKAPGNLRIDKVDYMSARLLWDPNTELEDKIVFQWKAPGVPNWTYRFTMPHTANRYVDLGLEPNSNYEYRLKVVKPNGDESNWATVKTKTTNNPHTKVFNVKNFGAVGNGTTNDTKAIRNAIEAARNEGGGIVYIPAGTYTVMPTTSKPEGQVVIFTMTSHITIKGDGPDKTIISFKMPGFKSPETNWLYTKDGKLMRGFVFSTHRTLDKENPTTNIVFDGIQVTGNTRPTGETAWWTNEQKEQGWDVSHKGLNINVGHDNLLVKNTSWNNFRGEIIYGGGLRHGKLKVVNTDVFGSNGSAVSTSTDFECDNLRVWDAANACVESTYYTLDLHQFRMKGIYRNSYFKPKGKMMTDKTANPILIKETGLWGVFGPNDAGSYTVMENNQFENAHSAHIYFGGSQNNIRVANNRFKDPGYLGFIYFQLKDKYLLERNGNNITIENNYFNASKGGLMINTTNWNNTNFKNIFIQNNTFEITGGNWVFKRDAMDDLSMRDNFVIRGNTITENGGKLSRITEDLKTSKKALWLDNKFPMRNGAYPAAEQSYFKNPGPAVIDIFPHDPGFTIHNILSKKDQEFRIPTNQGHYPDGFETTISKTHPNGAAVFKPNGAWNALPFPVKLTQSQSATFVVENDTVYLKKYKGQNALNFGDQDYVVLDENSPEKQFSFPLIHKGNKAKLFHLYIHGSDIKVTSSDKLQLTSDIKGNSDVSIEIVLSKDSNNSLIEVDRYECKRQLVLMNN